MKEQAERKGRITFVGTMKQVLNNISKHEAARI